MSGLLGLAVGAGCMISGGLTAIYVFDVRSQRMLFAWMEMPVLLALAIALWLTS